MEVLVVVVTPQALHPPKVMTVALVLRVLTQEAVVEVGVQERLEQMVQTS